MLCAAFDDIDCTRGPVSNVKTSLKCMAYSQSCMTQQCCLAGLNGGHTQEDMVQQGKEIVEIANICHAVEAEEFYQDIMTAARCAPDGSEMELMALTVMWLAPVGHVKAFRQFKHWFDCHVEGFLAERVCSFRWDVHVFPKVPRACKPQCGMLCMYAALSSQGYQCSSSISHHKPPGLDIAPELHEALDATCAPTLPFGLWLSFY